MSAITVLTSFPSASTNFVAVTTQKGRVLLSASRALVAGERIAYQLLRWDSSASAAFPVQQIVLDENAMQGRLDVPFESDGSSYHLLRSSGSDISGVTVTARIEEVAAVLGAAYFEEIIDPPAASATAVHAALAGNAASNTFPGPFTNPTTPRNVTATFAASYDGGNITVTGKRFGVTITETLVAVANSTVTGSKVFDEVVSAVKGAVGANAATVSLGTGNKMGTKRKLTCTKPVFLVDWVMQADHTVDTAESAITPDSGDVANGSKDFIIIGR